MGRLIAYVLGVAIAAGAEYLFVYYQSDGSLGGGHPSGWAILSLLYLAGASGAVGGLLGLVVAKRREPRSGWGLSLAQGIVAVLASFLVFSPALDLGNWFAGIAVCALAGAAGALLSFGVYVSRRANLAP